MPQSRRNFLTRAVFAATFASGLAAYPPATRGQGLVSADLSHLRSVGAVAISPDGHRIAYSVAMRDRPGRPYGQLWILDVASQKSTRIGGDNDRGGAPLWSPDGKSLAFQGSQGEQHGLFVARPDGSGVTFLAEMK